MNQKLSIVIPCYNESENIPHLIARLKEAFPRNCRDSVEVLLVDNGSTDDSAKIFERELAEREAASFMQLVKVEENQGYGFGILSGLAQATGELLSWTHADMQTDPADLLRARELFETVSQKKGSENFIVKGKRKNRKFLEAFFTWGMQVATWVILGKYLDDINAQPKLFSREFYERFVREQAPIDFSLDLYLLYQADVQKFKTLVIPVYFKDRLHGEAKGGGSWPTRIKLIKRTFAYIWKLRKTVV